MFDAVSVRPALEGAIYPGNNPEVKACFEDLCMTRRDVRLLDIVRTGSRPLGKRFFIQFCFATAKEVDYTLREGVPLEVVRPVRHETSCPFRVVNAYPQEKGAVMALNYVGVKPILVCNAGDVDCLMPQELEARIHALVRAEVNISLHLRAESSRRRLHAVDATSARWRRGACPSLVDLRTENGRQRCLAALCTSKGVRRGCLQHAHRNSDARPCRSSCH